MEGGIRVSCLTLPPDKSVMCMELIIVDGKNRKLEVKELLSATKLRSFNIVLTRER